MTSTFACDSRNMKKMLMALVSTLGLLSGASQAALIARDGGMVYDSTLNITWLQDWNYAKTSEYAAADSNGRMSWSAAVDWADGLSYGGYDDWRLPTLNPSDTTCSQTLNIGAEYPTQYVGYNCSGGELSHMFVTDMGNRAGESVLNGLGDTPEQVSNLSLFSRVQSYLYWSGVEYELGPILAWVFQSEDGNQGHQNKSELLYAVAVRDGDAAASVPEPQSLALALLALGAMMVTSRTRKPAAPTA